MVVELITFCYNEKVLLHFAIDYWRKFADKVTIVDNLSDDGSVEFLNEYPDYIRVLPNDTQGKINNDILRNIKNNIWKTSTADFCVVCDLDEFLVAKDIKSEFEKMIEGNYTVCTPRCFTMMSESTPQYNGQLLHEIRPFAYESASKTIILRPKYIKEMNYSIGAHDAHPEGYVKYYKGDIYLFHAANNLSLEYKINRYRMLNDRRRDEEKKRFLSMNYGMSEEEIKRNWENNLKKIINFKNILNHEE